MSSSIGSILKHNRPSYISKAHVLADYLFTFVARVSMEDSDVLTELYDIINDASNGEEDRDEMLTRDLLRDVAHHIILIRDEPPVGYEEHVHRDCVECRECVDCGLRPCRNGMSHTLQEA